MEIALAAGYTAFFFFLVTRLNFFRELGIPVRLLSVAFLIKVAAGILLGLIYTYYYTDRQTADTFKYFDDSAILFDSFRNSPFDFFRMITGIGATDADLQPYYDRMTNWYETFSPFNDNRTMIRFNAILRFFSMGYYNVHVVVVSFLSFTGMVAIARVYRREYPTLTLQVFLAFILLPSVLLWGSGLLKDSLVFFTSGLLLYFVDKTIHSRSALSIAWILVFLFLLMITKFYVFILFIPLIICWFISSRSKKQPLLIFGVGTVLFLSLILFVGRLNPEIDVISILASKQKAFFDLVNETGAGSAINIPVLEPTVSGLLKAVPVGFITAFVRPFITDSGPLLNTLSAVENTILLIWFLLCIFKIRKTDFSGKILPAFSIFYILMLFTLIGMITPVLGAIVRYKAQALPYFVTLLMIISYSGFKNSWNRYMLRK